MSHFYTTLTWDNWPEGGSYGDTVEAANSTEAEAMMRLMMAASRLEEQGGNVDDDDEVQRIVEEYGDDWHLVDCWDVDDFIARHALPVAPAVLS
jgi:hypothetical protein